MLGLPLEDDDLFREFVHNALEAVDVPTDERIAFSDELDAYLDERIAEHVAQPADDLITYLLGIELFGERLSHEHVRGCVVLLLLAGIDTTWSAIGSGLWHLATHPDDRRRLVADPELIPTAVEELLRAYAPVTMARFVAKDHDFHGHPMKQGEWVLLPSRRRTVILMPSINPTMSSSTGWRTATPPSALASTAASAPTSLVSSYASPSRSFSPPSPSSRSPIPPASRSCGALVRFADPVSFRCASADHVVRLHRHELVDVDQTKHGAHERRDVLVRRVGVVAWLDEVNGPCRAS